MNVVLFGATGMVGQGVLRECLIDSDVQRVFSIVRSATGQKSEKLREIVVPNFLDFDSIAGELAGLDACFFCLGVSSAGMTEERYTEITYEITMAAARALLKASPGLTFIYVSGAGTDNTELGRTMWARVKGKTENALLRMGFKAAYMFRPGIIQPLHGITPKTRAYRIFYVFAKSLLPLLRAAFPKQVTTTEQIGRAMLQVARKGYSRPVLESRDITRF